MTINDVLVKNLTYYRHNMGLNKTSFAKVCGVNRTTLENIYSGLNTISLTTLEQIADGLGCKPSDLILDWDGELKK